MLVGLRIALVVYVLLSFGSMVSSGLAMNRYGNTVAIQMILRSILGALPVIAVLIAVSVRTPPTSVALDAAAGFGVASILFRFVTFGAMAMTPAFRAMPDVSFLLLRLGAFSALEALIAGLALHVRGSVGGMSLGSLAVATVAFLVWDGVVQVAMQMLVTPVVPDPSSWPHTPRSSPLRVDATRPWSGRAYTHAAVRSPRRSRALIARPQAHPSLILPPGFPPEEHIDFRGRHR